LGELHEPLPLARVEERVEGGRVADAAHRAMVKREQQINATIPH
jgi:hypothetical protein